MSRETLQAIRNDLAGILVRLDAELNTSGEPVKETPVSIQIDPQLIADLKRDEGLRLAAYPDPITHGEPWTIGYGHCGPEVHPGLVWTQADADAALLADIERHSAELRAALSWVSGLDPARQRVLDNMAFNLGVGVAGGNHGLLSFKNTLGMVQGGRYFGAADGMLRSLWAKQVGSRAIRLAETMRTGA